MGARSSSQQFTFDKRLQQIWVTVEKLIGCVLKLDLFKSFVLWHFGTLLSGGLNHAGLAVGLVDLEDLFPPK